MRTTSNRSAPEPAPSKPAIAKPPDIVSAPVPDTLAALHVNPDTGLTHAEVDVRRKEHGRNEVAEKREHPVLEFLRKFWGISAWMLELIMVLSAVLGKYSDLVVVSALLIVNAVVSFMQERRAAGVVETLRQRLQISSRVLREANWQVVPARELVPGDIVRMRAGDIIPADVKLLTGTVSVDQSALTGESKDAAKATGEVLSSGSVVRRGEALLVLWIGWSRFGLATSDNALYTFSFLTLLYFAAFSIVSARERRWFWATMPSKAVVAAVVAETLVGTVLTFVGLPGLMPLPWWQTLAIFVYAMVACLVVNDAVKVAMIKWATPSENHA